LPQRDAKAPSQRRPLLVSRSRANYKRTRLEQVHQLNRARASCKPQHCRRDPGPRRMTVSWPLDPFVTDS
jgi:hypothetical protein